jgi:hypothetical protein
LNVTLRREKTELKLQFEMEKKEMAKEIEEYKFKSYNVLNDNATLKKKIKSLNNTILDRDIELKTQKQDREKCMEEVINLKGKFPF